MPTWRKWLFVLILVALLVLTIVFWGTMAGACFVIAFIQSFGVYVFNQYASSDLAKTFQEDGEHVKGWRE
jgi:small basic protein